MALDDHVVSASTARRIRDLPGPSGLPLLGSALQIRIESLHQRLEQWSGEYGDIFRFRIALQEFVVISRPETIARVLRDRPDGFKRRRRLEETFRELGVDGLFSAKGEAWKRQRPMILHGLDPTHVKAFFPTLLKVTERFARRWHRAVAAGEEIDLHSDLTLFTVDVTSGLAFGSDINTTESGPDLVQSHIGSMRCAMHKRLMAPVRYWRYVKLPRDRELDWHLAALRKVVDDFICGARRRLERDPRLREQPSNLIEAMIAARDGEGSQLTDEDVSANVLTMLVAGEDTTADTLAWTLWFLHSNRETMNSACREIEAVLGNDAYPTRHDQLNEMAFVQACAHEAMRLKPVAPILILEAARDVAVEDVPLPAGTPVICLMRRGVLDERHFPDPLVFRPERWLTPIGTPEESNSAKRIAMPFGAGPRICPGRYLAFAEIKMLLAMLLGGFEVKSVATPDGLEPHERLALSMSPVGLKLRLRSRDANKARTTAEPIII